MAQSTSTNHAAIQQIGLYQLENLQRQQAKFMMVVLLDGGNEGAIPVHPLLKKDLILNSAEALEKIMAFATERQMPAWWPIVLMSQDGVVGARVGDELSKHGYINVYAYRGGWTAPASGT